MNWLESSSLLNEIIQAKLKLTQFPSKSNVFFDHEKFILSILEYLGKTLEKKPYNGTRMKREKNNAESVKYRKLGNEAYSTSSIDPETLEEALSYYTQSIALAESNSEEIALGFANRSAALLNLNRPMESLRDIERALQLNYPEKLKPKLYHRRAVCFAKLADASYIQSKFWLDKVPSDSPNIDKMEKLLKEHPSQKSTILNEEEVVPELSSSHKDFPCASDAIDVACSREFGRHIVATRDIEIGEVLLVEKPYSRYLDSIDCYHHCSNCLRCLWDGVPCDGGCINAVYCSESCKTSAWEKYHRLECTVLDLILQHHELYVHGTCLRLLLQATVEAGGIQSLKERVNNIQIHEGVHQWPIQPKWYQNSTLETIFTLGTYEHNSMAQDEFAKFIEDAIRTAFYLATYTNYFGIQYDRKKMCDADIAAELAGNENFLFIAKLYYKILQIHFPNCEWFVEYDSGASYIKGYMTMSFLSLFNHSCFPNTAKQSKRDHVVLYASLPIKKGQQVFDIYTFLNCAVEWKNTRAANLMQTYGFTCNCIACVENWPPKDYLESYEVRAKSPEDKDKIKSAFQKYLQLKEKISNNDLSDKDQMLKTLYNILKVVYEGVNLPCSNTHDIMKTIRNIYNKSGSIARLQENPASI